MWHCSKTRWVQGLCPELVGKNDWNGQSNFSWATEWFIPPGPVNFACFASQWPSFSRMLGNRLPFSVVVGSGDVELAGCNFSDGGYRIQVSLFLQNNFGAQILFHPPVFFSCKMSNNLQVVWERYLAEAFHVSELLQSVGLKRKCQSRPVLANSINSVELILTELALWALSVFRISVATLEPTKAPFSPVIQ